MDLTGDFKQFPNRCTTNSICPRGLSNPEFKWPESKKCTHCQTQGKPRFKIAYAMEWVFNDLMGRYKPLAVPKRPFGSQYWAHIPMQPKTKDAAGKFCFSHFQFTPHRVFRFVAVKALWHLTKKEGVGEFHCEGIWKLFPPLKLLV